MRHDTRLIRISKLMAATAVSASLVGAQTLPLPLASSGIPSIPGLDRVLVAQADEDTCELTLVHEGAQSSYHSFSEALSAAQDGDTLCLDSDASVTSVIRTDKAVTLDLNGHTLAAALGSGKSGALSFSGTGAFTLADSGTGAGALAVTLGSSRETSGSAGSYRAVSVTGSGSFVVDGARITATYTGSSTASNLPTPALYGIVLEAGSLTLQNGASIVAKGSEDADAYGANRVAGIYAPTTDAASKVVVSADSSVRAENDAESAPRGSWQVPDTTYDSTTYDASHLVQIFPDEDSAFYREVCEKFKQVANFDDAEEASATSSSSSDTEVYYAAPLTLESGVAVWAYSEPQDANGKGALENIVPKYLFVQADYVLMTSAYGISSGTAFAGTVEISGEVAATCKNGDAYALYAQGGSTWETDAQAKLSESAGTAEERVEYGLLDLERYFDPESSSSISALGNTSGRVVYAKTPRGADAFVGSSAKVTLDAAAQDATDTSVDLKSDGIVVDDEKASELWKTPDVSVSFANVRSADGTQADTAQAGSLALGTTLASAGITLPDTAASYAGDDGTTYRFIGWRSGSSVFTADALQDDVLVNSALSGASKGAVTFTAAYLAVPSGSFLVQFVVDGRVLAYAAQAGATPSYEAAGGSDEEPDKIDEKTGYDYEFEGWQQDGATLETLPAVTADAVYTASFEETPAEESLVLRYLDANGQWVTTNGLTAPFGADTNDYAEDYATQGEVIKTSEQVYTFTGWGPRYTDVDALYAPGELPAIKSTGSFRRFTNRYYAKYTSEQRMLNVAFVVDGAVYARTSEAIATSTDFDEVLASCGVSNPADKSSTQKFLGWSATQGSTTVDISKTNAATLAAVAPDESDDLTLYAVFGSSSSAESDVTRTDVTVKLDDTAKKEITVDASRLHITAADLDEASELTLTITAAGYADDTVSKNVSRMDYEALVGADKRKAIYEAHLTYKLNGVTHEVYDDFGAIKIAVQVPRGARSDKVRAFWLASTGINYSDVSQNKSSFSFSVQSLGYVDDGVGNIEIALQPTSSASLTSATANVATASKTSAATPALPSVTTPATPSVSAASTATATAAAGAAGATAAPSATDAADDTSDTDAADSSQTGNLVGFAAALALLAALAARVVWFFVKRRRGDSEEEEADPLPDQETVSF